MTKQHDQPAGRRLARLKGYATLVYALQAASFLVGVTSVVALIISYMKRPEAEGSFLASHFTWQIRTYWYGLLWGIVGLLTRFLLIGYLILLVDIVWILYRVVKGWLQLREDKSPWT